MSPMALVTRPSASSVRATTVRSTSAFTSLSSVAVMSEEAFSASTPRAHPVALRRAEGGRIRAGFRHGVAVLIHPDGAAGQQVGVRSLAVLIRFQHGCLLGRHAGEVVGEVIACSAQPFFSEDAAASG